MIIGLLLGSLVFLLLYPWPAPGSHGSARGVFAVLEGGQPVQDDDSWSAPLLRLLRIRVDRNSRLAKELAMSGLPIALEDAYAYRLLMPVIMGLMFIPGALQGSKVAYLFLAVCPIWYRIPEALISIQADAVRERIRRSIPPFLQALAVMIEAGLNLVPAIHEYSRRVQGPLSDQLQRTVQEMNLGVPQGEALRNCAERCEIPELHLALSALAQGLQRGAGGLAQVVREQAKEAWEKRRDSAREMGQRPRSSSSFPCWSW